MLKPDDIEGELWPPKPKGGMQTGQIPNGVKLRHIPTGNVAISVSQRSQHLNKERALLALALLINDD